VTIGAVSGNLYTPVAQYRYFDTSIDDNQILSLMQQYGISQSGDTDLDLKELYEAMYSDAKTTVNKNVSSAQQTQKDKEQQAQQTTTNVSWANLMNQAGLSVSGDFQKDYQTFNNKIFQMKLSATKPEDKAIISQMVSQAEIVFTQPANASSESSGKLPPATGADSRWQEIVHSDRRPLWP